MFKVLNQHVPQEHLILTYLTILSKYYQACYHAFPARNYHCLQQELKLAKDFMYFAEVRYFEIPIVAEIIKSKTYLRYDRIQLLLNLIRRNG